MVTNACPRARSTVWFVAWALRAELASHGGSGGAATGLSLLCVVSMWCPCVRPAAEGGLWAVLVPNWAVPTLCLKCWEPRAHPDTCRELCQGSCVPWAQRPFPEQEAGLNPGNGCTGASRSPPGDLWGWGHPALLRSLAWSVLWVRDWWWHCSWWPSGHPEVLFPGGGFQVIPDHSCHRCAAALSAQ